jgi:hypothetical protein
VKFLLYLVFAAALVLTGPLAADTGKPDPTGELSAALVGTWSANVTLPNGIQLRGRENYRRDGSASGHIVTLFRDGSVKASTSYNFSWRIAGRILVSEGFVRVPKRDDQPDSSRDEIVHLDAGELVLKDLSNNVVVHFQRVR